MWPDRVSNPGPLTYESDALPTALCGRHTHTKKLSGHMMLNDIVLMQRDTTSFWQLISAGNPWSGRSHVLCLKPCPLTLKELPLSVIARHLQ